MTIWEVHSCDNNYGGVWQKYRVWSNRRGWQCDLMDILDSWIRHRKLYHMSCSLSIQMSLLWKNGSRYWLTNMDPLIFLHKVMTHWQSELHYQRKLKVDRCTVCYLRTAGSENWCRLYKFIHCKWLCFFNCSMKSLMNWKWHSTVRKHVAVIWFSFQLMYISAGYHLVLCCGYILKCCLKLRC